MNKDENNSIETLSYEIENQELEGKSGSGFLQLSNLL